MGRHAHHRSWGNGRETPICRWRHDRWPRSIAQQSTPRRNHGRRGGRDPRIICNTKTWVPFRSHLVSQWKQVVGRNCWRKGDSKHRCWGERPNNDRFPNTRATVRCTSQAHNWDRVHSPKRPYSTHWSRKNGTIFQLDQWFHIWQGRALRVSNGVLCRPTVAKKLSTTLLLWRKEADSTIDRCNFTPEDGTMFWDTPSANLANLPNAMSSDGCPSRSSSATTMHGQLKTRKHGITKTESTGQRCWRWGEKSSWKDTGIHWIVTQSREDWWLQLFEYRRNMLGKSSRSKDQHIMTQTRSPRAEAGLGHWQFVQHLGIRSVVSTRDLCAWTSTMKEWTCNWRRNSHRSWQVDITWPEWKTFLPSHRRDWSQEAKTVVETTCSLVSMHLGTKWIRAPLRTSTQMSRHFLYFTSQSRDCWSIDHSWHIMVMWSWWILFRSMKWPMSGPQNLPPKWESQQLTPRRSQATKSWMKLCVSVNTQKYRHPCKLSKTQCMDWLE